MALISAYRKSRFLAKTDLADGPQLATIHDVVEEAVGEEKEVKPVISFVEDIKPLIANMSALESVAEINGDDDTDNWRGTRVELYVDPSIRFGGKKVGGIRIRRPVSASTPASDPNDPIPF